MLKRATEARVFGTLNPLPRFRPATSNPPIVGGAEPPLCGAAAGSSRQDRTVMLAGVALAVAPPRSP